MTDNHDASWAALAGDWQQIDASSAETGTALAARVQSRGRLLAIWVAVEHAIGAVAIAVLGYLSATTTSTTDRVMMWTLSGACAAAMLFSVWNWRGSWLVETQSQREFLALSRARCLRFRRAIGAGWLLLAAEVAALEPWMAVSLHGRRETAAGYLAAYGWLAALAGAGIVFLLALGRGVAREEAAIAEYAAQVERES